MIKENHLNQNKDIKEALLNHLLLPTTMDLKKQHRPKLKDVQKDI
jgi:hypothetical protein